MSLIVSDDKESVSFSSWEKVAEKSRPRIANLNIKPADRIFYRA
jgi:hypothetical protein